MARRRMIDPTLWDDEDVGGLSNGAFRTFIACVSNADDEGKLEASARRLMGIAFRFRDDISIAEVEAYRDEMCAALRSVVLYTIGNKQYIKFLKWHHWQTIKKPYPSTIPEPGPDNSGTSSPPVGNQGGTSSPPVGNSGDENTDSTLKTGGGGTGGEPVGNQGGTALHEGKRSTREEKGSNNARTSDTTGETDSPSPAAACSLSLCSLFFKLNARHASDNDRKLNKELAARADWVEHVALTAMDLCHRCAVEREPNFVAKSLRYYADAITRALETGQLPGQESQKNGGRNGSRVGAFLAQGFQPYNAAGKTYYLDDSMIYKTNTMPTQEMIDDELDKYERKHPERVVVNDA